MDEQSGLPVCGSAWLCVAAGQGPEEIMLRDFVYAAVEKSNTEKRKALYGKSPRDAVPLTKSASAPVIRRRPK